MNFCMNDAFAKDFLDYKLFVGDGCSKSVTWWLHPQTFLKTN